jgi:hypothetical protein
LRPGSHLERAALGAHLVGGDLLEAVHEVGRARQVGEEELRALLHPLDEVHEFRPRHLAGDGNLAELAHLLAQRGRGGERDPDRRVDLVRDAGDQLPERGELLGLDQVGLRLAQLG